MAREGGWLVTSSLTRHVGIVGHAADKFTEETEDRARELIGEILITSMRDYHTILVSGGCHLGGIDIWAEEVANELGLAKQIFLPERLFWSGGFRERNLEIAELSDVVHCIVVADYPEGYELERFGELQGKPYCYHCKSRSHVKSGGCWTMHRAKTGVLHVI